MAAEHFMVTRAVEKSHRVKSSISCKNRSNFFLTSIVISKKKKGRKKTLPIGNCEGQKTATSLHPTRCTKSQHRTNALYEMDGTCL